jgi:general secretion pathway protein I
MPIDARKLKAGFTLLEILIAFTILGLAGATIMSIFGNGTAKVSHAEKERVAELSARSVMALIGTEVPLEPGTQQGKTSDGNMWSVVIQPYETSTQNMDSGKSSKTTRPYLVTIQATIGKEADHVSATVSSVRIKPVVP